MGFPPLGRIRTQPEMSGFPQPTGRLIPLTIGTGQSLTGNGPLVANSFTRILTGAGSAPQLPNNPPAGTECWVEKSVSNTTAYTVTPTGGATIEGTSLGLVLRTFGQSCGLQYDGTNWQILSIQPDQALTLVAAGAWNQPGVVASPNSQSIIGAFQWFPRQGNTFTNTATMNWGFGVSGPIQVVAAGHTGIDVNVQAPAFSAGTFTIIQLEFFLTDAAGANSYHAVLQNPQTLTSHQTGSPASNLPLLSDAVNWTVTIVGANLTTSADGSTIDAAGAITLYYVGFIACQLLAWIP